MALPPSLSQYTWFRQGNKIMVVHTEFERHAGAAVDLDQVLRGTCGFPSDCAAFPLTK